jgi:ribonuclease D
VSRPLVISSAELEALVDRHRRAVAYAIDTEFHRERTYFPQVALVQLAVGDEVVLIDPLACDLRPLAGLLEGPGTAVVHAGTQDLEVLELACGTVPARLFDTQIAAGFLGTASASLASLLERELGVGLAKGDRLTDWLRRPLSAEQLEYAAADVTHLLPLAGRLRAELARRDRLAWVEAECEALRTRPRGRRPPEDAVLRLKEARRLKGSAARVAAALAAWRERRAASQDIPVRHVLSDVAIVAIAQHQPVTAEALDQVRGVDRRHLRGEVVGEILAAVQLGLGARDRAATAARPADLPRQLKPVVTLVTSWVGQLGRDHHIDPALLATRSDVEALLRGDASSRLLTGWRAELIGEPVRRLVAGEAALAFDGDGRLVLERRSGRPIDDGDSFAHR